MIFDMPQIPFEVYYRPYHKTVRVNASCARSKDAATIFLDLQASGDRLNVLIYKAIEKAFDSPGITTINICRVDKNK